MPPTPCAVRRWKSGTVAKREIRKLTRTTHLLFPKRPFQRLVREITQVGGVQHVGAPAWLTDSAAVQDFKSDVRFTDASLQAIQEAAEIFVTEMFHKSDMARKHTRRNTLHVEDIRFSRFMTQVLEWLRLCVCVCVLLLTAALTGEPVGAPRAHMGQGDVHGHQGLGPEAAVQEEGQGRAQEAGSAGPSATSSSTWTRPGGDA